MEAEAASRQPERSGGQEGKSGRKVGRTGTRSDVMHYTGAKSDREETSMRTIMLALTAAFVVTGSMAVITTARAQDSKTIIKHDDGDKTVVKKKDDLSGNKKVIIHKHDE
jgi:hypothetical protein